MPAVILQLEKIRR